MNPVKDRFYCLYEIQDLEINMFHGHLTDIYTSVYKNAYYL